MTICEGHRIKNWKFSTLHHIPGVGTIPWQTNHCNAILCRSTLQCSPYCGEGELAALLDKYLQEQQYAHFRALPPNGLGTIPCIEWHSSSWSHHNTWTSWFIVAYCKRIDKRL